MLLKNMADFIIIMQMLSLEGTHLLVFFRLMYFLAYGSELYCSVEKTGLFNG